MARALIVGCGCRGRMLGEALLGEGWAVRGTSRRPEGLEAIAAAGIEPALADPDRPGTLLELVDDVAVLVHLLGSATGEPEEVIAVHGPRLARLLEHLVETPVRGFAYEAVGRVDARVLEDGAGLVREARGTWRIPVAILADDPSAAVAAPAWEEWLDSALQAVSNLLAPAREPKELKSDGN
ncbi:MAG TPA: hypothetical protein VFR04_03525 [Solirubrobacterales bacterium]|nr:hypothetical protein [Solirubrobacterales bacterium]